MRERTPLQEAKAAGLPYVKLVIDRRHLNEGHGMVAVEGPVSQEMVTMAFGLLHAILGAE